MPTSQIRAIMNLAWATPGTIHLEVGEPNFETPPHITEAAHRAASGGRTHYTPNGGIPPLRDALAAKVTARNGYPAGPDQIVVAAGGVEALHGVFHTLTDPGDEILIPDPSWTNFRMIAHLVGAPAVAYPLRPETGFVPRIEDLEPLVTERTRILLLNSPSNPVGSVIDRATLRDLVDFAHSHDLWIISDECYDELDFSGRFCSTMAAAPSDRVIGVYSFSKVYAMTGWRVGYAVLPPEAAALMAELQEAIISCVNEPAQWAALAALEGPQSGIATMRDEYRSRRDIALETLAAHGVRPFRPDGAFYLWIDVGTSAMAFCERLLEEEKVAVAPGSAFGPSGEHFIRMSLASSPEDLRTGCDRLGRFLARHH